MKQMKKMKLHLFVSLLGVYFIKNFIVFFNEIFVSLIENFTEKLSFPFLCEMVW
jgi:hypothetical protein